MARYHYFTAFYAHCLMGMRECLKTGVWEMHMPITYNWVSVERDDLSFIDPEMITSL